MNKQEFIKAALETYPDLTDTISRQQVLHIMSKYNLKDPHLEKIGRGMFAFHNTLSEKSVPKESDQEIEVRIKERFNAIDLCVRSAAENRMRSVILSGPPGVGKSYGVTRTLENFPGCNFVFASGRSAATGLYKLLYDNRFSNSVVVLDDIDSVFESIDALNILKKACDRSAVRRISWLTESKFFSDEDGAEIPKSFEFEGSIVLITNIDFDEQINKGSKLSPHFAALISRSFYVNLGIKTQREFIIRIKQVVKEESMLRQEGLSEQEENRILSFIEQNAFRLRELSLRMCAKLADIYKIDSNNFEKLAGVTCFKG